MSLLLIAAERERFNTCKSYCQLFSKEESQNNIKIVIESMHPFGNGQQGPGLKTCTTTLKYKTIKPMETKCLDCHAN